MRWLANSAAGTMFLAALLIIHPGKSSAQVKTETPAPYFILNVIGPDGKAIGKKSVSDFQGKWLILDFWTRYCIACIQSMPKLNEYQKQLGERATILLIGNNDKRYGHGIEDLYKRFAKKGELKLHHAFDTTIFGTYSVSATPHIVIINPVGKIYAVTSSAELNKEKLQALVEGRKPTFEKLQGITSSRATGDDVANPSGPQQLPLGALNGTVGLTDNKMFHYSSTLSRSKMSQPISLNLDLVAANGRFTTSSTSLERLYLLAYFGKGSWRIGDSLYLKVSKQVRLKNPGDTSRLAKQRSGLKELYNYAMELEGGHQGIAGYQTAMQKDLATRFGYEVTIENAWIEIFELHLSAPSYAAKLKTKARAPSMSGDAAGYIFRDKPISALLERIAYFHPKVILSDKSGIGYNIDLYLSANMLDIVSIRNSLKQVGIELVPVQRHIQTLALSLK